jgi:hypothetical protein
MIADIGGDDGVLGTPADPAAAAAAAKAAGVAVEALHHALDALEVLLVADEEIGGGGATAAHHDAAEEAAARVQVAADEVARLGAAARSLEARVAKSEERLDFYMSECLKALFDTAMGDSAQIFIETLVAVKVYDEVASLCTFAEGKTLHVLLFINVAFDYYQSLQQKPKWWERVEQFAIRIGVRLVGVKVFVKERFLDQIDDSVSTIGRVRL